MSSPHVGGEAVLQLGQAAATCPVCQLCSAVQNVGLGLENLWCHVALTQSFDAWDLFGDCHQELTRELSSADEMRVSVTVSQYSRHT